LEYLIDFWIILAGALCACSCCIPGTWLLVRGEAMLGDAISHAVLPGIAVAFLLTGTKSIVWMVLGAGVASIFVAFASKFLQKKDALDSSAALGVVFTTLFALGLLLIARAASGVDLDPNCVIYGSIELVPLNQISFYGIGIPKAVFILLIIFIFNILLSFVLFKEWMLTSFDPTYARAIGWKLWKIEFPLLFSTAITCIAAFEIVGSILVVAMLVIPPATGLVLSKRLPMVFFLSMVFGVVSVIGGHIASVGVPQLLNFKSVSSAGCMVVFSGLILIIAIAFQRQKVFYF
tara:strand:+ start:51 stop:923 length:873 start_codon:yes stop_codon:yes gene_type:complete